MQKGGNYDMGTSGGGNEKEADLAARYDKIVKELKMLSVFEGMQFMLLTKSSGSNSEIKMSYSSPYTDSQAKHIKSIVENPTTMLTSTDICLIRPALKFYRQITLSRRSTDVLIKHYSDLMMCLSQAICKEVAKQWIKVAEPNKQALYPYKYVNKSKPSWWPSTVNHIEPDHLDKTGRIKVLINILRNPEFSLTSLRARTRVLSFKNLVIHNVLDELYYLAAYDRLFFDQLREQNPLYVNLSEQEKESFKYDTLNILVSDLSAGKMKSKKPRVIMISQIKPYHLNERVFQVNENYPPDDEDETNISNISEIAEYRNRQSVIHQQPLITYKDQNYHNGENSPLSEDDIMPHPKRLKPAFQPQIGMATKNSKYPESDFTISSDHSHYYTGSSMVKLESSVADLQSERMLMEAEATSDMSEPSSDQKYNSPESLGMPFPYRRKFSLSPTPTPKAFFDFGHINEEKDLHIEFYSEKSDLRLR